MFKKTMCMLLTMVMLLTLVVPAAGAEETSSKPTVEEILNSYHEKAFALQTSGETESPAAYSRSGGSQKTLEQETVDELTAAGYEAYNITAENYDALEESLKTDFAAMGMDPNESYIIVISGEDPEETASSNSRLGSLPEQDIIDDGGPSFTYTYDGTAYKMRYVTVTTATGAYMRVSSTYSLQERDWLQELTLDLLSAFVIAKADNLVKNVPLGTFGALLYDANVDDNYTLLDPGTLTLHADTLWTCRVIEVYNENFGRWDTAQASAYAVSKARCAGYLYDETINDTVWFNGEEHSIKNYSPNYYDFSQCKYDAAVAFCDGQVKHDRTGDIDFYLGDETGEVIFVEEGEPLFTHCEHWLLP